MASGEHGSQGRPRAAPTLYDVAALAGVSHQTVSRLVKGHTNISPETRRRIEQAIDSLHYRPNHAARALATARSRRLGVLFFDRLDEVGPTRSLQAASDRARSAGYLLDVVNVDPRDEEELASAIRLVSHSDVAGVMVFAATDAAVAAVQGAHLSVPVRFASRAHAQGGTERNSSGAMAARVATEHLADLGHRRLVHIAGPLDWAVARDRRDAYDTVVSERGLTSAGVIEGDWSARSGYVAAHDLAAGSGITGVVASNDQMALGLLRGLRERGFRVPNAVSVVGCDDIPEARFFEPPLTTVRLDIARQGSLAMERLLAEIDPAFTTSGDRPAPPQLIARATTGPPQRSDPGIGRDSFSPVIDLC